MFLQQLNETEKKAFIEMAHVIAISDGIMNEHELQMLNAYNREMGIHLALDDLEQPPLEEIIAAFASETSRRISFIEGLAIALTDGGYDEQEKIIINRIREAYGFTVEYYEEVKAWLKTMNSVYQQGLGLLQ